MVQIDIEANAGIARNGDTLPLEARLQMLKHPAIRYARHVLLSPVAQCRTLIICPTLDPCTAPKKAMTR